MDKVLFADGCWEWCSEKDRNGYGVLRIDGAARRRAMAHRISYEFFTGPIPADKQIDHLCRNHGCVNPVHLEAVTQRENILRGQSACASHARKMTCKRGHEFTKRADGKGRICYVCMKINRKARALTPLEARVPAEGRVTDAPIQG